MDKMKTLKLASKYFLMLATFCILSENYLCSIIVTKEDQKYIPKDTETTRLSTTTRRTKFQRNLVHLRETKENKSEIFRKRRAYVQDTCMIHRQKLPNITG